MAQPSYNFRCPGCKQVIATLTGSDISITGSATICGNFPPQNYNSNWVQCSKCNRYCVAEGGSGSYSAPSSVQKITAHLGSMELLSGDWLMTDGHYGGFYKHHFIYIGNGEFVSRQLNGVLLEGKAQYHGKKAWLIYRGGQGCANKAKSRIGDKKYDLATNNCEHFCSDCSGFGHKSEQVFISAGKAAVKLGSALANAINSNPNMKFTSSFQGGVSSMGGFSAGVRFNF
eukprot:264515_1